MIRVLHVTEDHSIRNTGISAAVDAMTRCVPDSIQPVIACVGEDVIPVGSGVTVQSFPTHGLSKVWRASPGQSEALSQLVAAADVIHLHGLWMWIQLAAARQASSQGKPVVLTPHGMLAPWIWQRQALPNRWKKQLYWKFLAYPAFRNVNIVHALTVKESNTLAGYFPGQKQAIIPHPLDLQKIDGFLSNLPARDNAEKPYILFLGRLHPVKAIHLLIRAFARLGKTQTVLKIAGFVEPREQAYGDLLHKLVSDLELEDRVIFTGPVQGAAKWQLYRDTLAFCLPSFSEGLSMVNLEAAACRVPVITSFESGVVEDWDRCGGVFIHSTEESIYQSLQLALGWSGEERLHRGESLRQLVETTYGWSHVGQQWATVYQTLAGGNDA